MDTTKFIRVRTVEPSMSFHFDREKRNLEYISSKRDKVPINNDLLVWIASQHTFTPPDKIGRTTEMFPIYYENTSYIDENLSFSGISEDGSVTFWFNEGVSVIVGIDSTVEKTFYKYKKVPIYGGDPAGPPDSALIKLTDKVKLYNHGYLYEDQVHWTNFLGE